MWGWGAPRKRVAAGGALTPAEGGSAEGPLKARAAVKYPFPLCSEKHPKAIIPFQRAEFEQGVKYRKRRPGFAGSLPAFSPQPASLSHAKNKPEETQLCWRLGQSRIKAAPDGYRRGTGSWWWDKAGPGSYGINSWAGAAVNRFGIGEGGGG